MEHHIEHPERGQLEKKMKYIVDPWNNFCRVFELPEEYPKEYCFNGGHPVNFQLVDWFYPTTVPQAAVSKEEWELKVGPIKEQEVGINHEELAAELTPFLKEKVYTKPERQYLVICDFGMAFTFSMP